MEENRQADSGDRVRQQEGDPAEDLSYIAFISYRHLPLDKQAAERVQKKIENYTIPKEYREKFGGKKFGRAFRDEDELPTTASLTDSIYYALDHSQFLVVICTPALPQSKWCEAEIKYFLKTHDRDHVLAILVDGDPEESFSPYLLHDFDEEGRAVSDFEPLAANIAGGDHTINNKSFNKEMVRLYATFIGCPFDSLWQRERRARTNRLLSMAAAAMAVLVVFLGVVLNRNAMIQEQNLQIQEQNTRLSSQNETIEQQNVQLQTRLASVFVDSGITKLENHDVNGALDDALASMESGDPEIYDHRVGKLFSDALCAYKQNFLRSSVVYSQSAEIKQIRLTDDKEHLILLDGVGVIRCIDLNTYESLWELPTGSKDTLIHTENLGDKLIYRTTKGVFCHSLKDGSLLWSYENLDTYGNYMEALSEDGSLYAMADTDYSRDAVELIFFNTEDGSEAGRVPLNGDDDSKPYVSSIAEAYAYGASFTSDNSLFVFGIPITMNDEKNTFKQRYWYVDMKTFEKTRVATGEYWPLTYGIEIDPADKSVFIAQYSRSSIYTVLCTYNGEGYEFKEKEVTHHFSTAGGVNMPDDKYEASDCRFLSKDGRIYIFSDNQMYIYDRASNVLGNSYSLTGTILNAYWADKENAVMEVISDDSYFIDYYLDYNEGKVLNSVKGYNAHQTGLTKAVPAGNGSVDDHGSYYAVSAEAPGKLFYIEFVSDPNRESVYLAPDDYESYGTYLTKPDSDTGLLFYNDYSAAAFDKKSGEILHTATFDRYLSVDSAVILDEEHFLMEGEVFSFDGTKERYTEAAENEDDFFSTYSYQNKKLYNGRILTMKDVACYGLGENITSEDPDTGLLSGYPQYTTFWIDGKPVEGSAALDTSLAFYYDFDETLLLTKAGENGLILQYGKPVEVQGDGYVVKKDAELWFTDVLSGKKVRMEECVPAPEEFNLALAHEKRLCAAEYEAGNVCVYDFDKETVHKLGKKYSADEIGHICFSGDDRYLAILSAAGRLDIYETDNYEHVYGDRVEELDNEYMSIYDFSVESVRNAELLFFSLGDNCVILETAAWTPVSVFECEKVSCDPVSERIYTMEAPSGEKPELASYPIYDIAALKAWAEEKRSLSE